MDHSIFIETIEYFGIAFASAISLIVISKFLLPTIIRKPVDYYDADEMNEDRKLVDRMIKAIDGNSVTFKDLDIKQEAEELPLTGEDMEQIRTMMESVYHEMEPDIYKELHKKIRKKRERKKSRKPSYKWKREELIEEANKMGIEIPEKATKSAILDLIKEKSE